jgi:hypothetical protein
MCRRISQGFTAREAVVSTGHAPAARREAGLLDALDEPARR